MSIFNNVAFLEGEQADAYKARKAEEIERKLVNDLTRTSMRQVEKDRGKSKDDNEKIQLEKMKKARDTGYLSDPYANNSRRHPELKYFDKKVEDAEKKAKASGKGLGRFTSGHKRDEADKEEAKYDRYLANNTAGWTDVNRDIDAINKDMRRHPDRWKRGEDGKMHRESTIFESVHFLND